MAGALAQDATRRAAAPTNDGEDPGLPPEQGLDLLDSATEHLLEGLQRRAPGQAEAAAIFSQAPRGSLPGALGAGLNADLQTRLGMLGLPGRLRGQAANTRLVGARARGEELNNRVNELNFGYLTEPWNTADPGADPGQPGAGGLAGPAGPAGQAQGDTIAPAPVTPVRQDAGPPGQGQRPAAPAPGPDGQVAQAGTDPANPQGLPLTPESQVRLNALHGQLARAAQYINRSPRARQDYYAILEEAVKTVQEDPLAKQALTQQNTQQTSDVDMVKQLHLKAVDIGHEAYDEAGKEAAALAAAPNSQVDPSQPEAYSAWIDNRAKQIFAERFKGFASTLKSMGQDPTKFLADVAGAGAPGAAAAAPTSAAPTGAPAVAPGAAAALPADVAAEMDQEQPPTGGSGSPDAAAAPTSAGAGAPSPFIQKQLTPTEQLAKNKEQEEAATNVNMLEQWYQGLNRALKINDKAAAGTFADLGIKGHQIVDAGRGVLGMKRGDEYLNSTAEMQSILSMMSLQNLNTLIKGRFTNSELSFVQQLESSLDQTPQQRERLFKRGLQIIGPRLTFERMRMDAYNQGHPIAAGDYREWLERNYGAAAMKEIMKGGWVDPGVVQKALGGGK